MSTQQQKYSKALSRSLRWRCGNVNPEEISLYDLTNGIKTLRKVAGLSSKELNNFVKTSNEHHGRGSMILVFNRLRRIIPFFK